MRSRLSLFIILIIYLVSFKQYANYQGLLKGGGDCWGYYVYLPSAFIYHDLKDLKQTLQKRSDYNPRSVVMKADGTLQIEEAHAYGSHVIIKYTCGVALLYAPFFFIAHLFCKVSHLYPADGFSMPYDLLISLSSLIYSILGLWFLRKILLKYFSDSITAVTLTAIAIGTNLYYFSVLNCGMSHPYLFALYAVLLYASDQYYETEKMRYPFLIACCCGLITLIRPDEIIAILIPLLWNVSSFEELKGRIRFLLSKPATLLFVLFICVAVNLPQFIYWKWLSGNWLYYSYTHEGFDFLHPHIKQGLIGPSNGWLSYTPIMLFSVTGLFFLPRYFRRSAWATYLFLPLHIYLIYSWWCWQYINGFGSRPMVEIYPLLAFPFACILVVIRDLKWIRIFSAMLLLFFIFLNLFQTWQFDKGLIWTEDANWAFYKAIFLKSSGDRNSLITYDCGETQPDENKLTFVKALKENGFEDSSSSDYISGIRKNGQYAFELHKGSTPELRVSAEGSGISPSDYIKVSCWVYCPQLQYDHYKQAVLAAEFIHGGNQIRWRPVRLQNKIHNTSNSIWHPGVTDQWEFISFFTKVPHRFKTGDDVLKVLAWNPSDVPIIIDDIRVELWRNK